jgi:hypothetical protein
MTASEPRPHMPTEIYLNSHPRYRDGTCQHIDVIDGMAKQRGRKNGGEFLQHVRDEVEFAWTSALAFIVDLFSPCLSRIPSTHVPLTFAALFLNI